MAQRVKGDRYRPIVTIAKIKKGLPTRIVIAGNTYVLAHKDQWVGNRHSK